MTSRRVRLLLKQRQSNVHLRNLLERYPIMMAQYKQVRFSADKNSVLPPGVRNARKETKPPESSPATPVGAGPALR